MQFGERLRRAREEKKLTLNEVEAATKIRVSYLEALEKENVSVLPGKAYAIGFLKTYAKFLNIAHEELLAEIKSLYQETEPQESEDDLKITPINTASKSRYLYIFAAGFILIVVLVLVNNFKAISTEQSAPTSQGETSNKEDKEQNEKIKDPNSNNPLGSSTVAPDTQGNASASGSTYLKEGQEVVLRANDRVWISVSADGKKIFEGIISKGQEKVFTGKTIKVKLGNAFAVNVIHNGIDLGIIGTDNRVMTKIFTE